MSVPESAVCALSAPPSKPEVKPRPPVPSKPTPDPPQTEKGIPGKSGKVKHIVNKFNQPEPSPGPAQTQAPSPGTGTVVSNGSNGADKTSPQRQAPEVMPKPRVSKGPQAVPDQAPPLPMKRSRLRKSPNVPVYGNTPGARVRSGSAPVIVEGGRSAPDGKEGELLSAAGLETEVDKCRDAPPSPRCVRNCSCVCHLVCPGMKLVWVPLEDGAEEVTEKVVGARGEQGDEERRGEGESRTVVEQGDARQEEVEEEEEGLGAEDEDEDEVELYLSGSSDESESASGDGELTSKAKFQHTLELVGEQLRRRSDPGPHVVLTSYTTSALSPGGFSKAQSMDDDSDIYEINIVVDGVNQRPHEPQVPLIRIKPPRRSKLSSSASDEMDAATTSDDSPPPAIPPRVPLLPEKPWGGIALPQPSPDERRALRQASPLPSPPASPRPHRHPPVPPSKLGQNGLRDSSQSLNSLPPSTDEICEGKEDVDKDKPPVAPPRKQSIDWESMDEPLYQTYRESVITKAIRQQTVCRNISKTSVDFQMDHGHRRGSVASVMGGIGGALGSRASPIPQGARSTLWQDLPAVRDSGVLEKLSSDECKYQESIFEVLTSEVSYLRSLRVLTEHFMDSRELQDTLIIRDRVPLFSNILRIREVSERFLKDLEDRMEYSLIITDICDIIHYHAQHNFPAYIDYVRNQIYQEKTYTSLMRSNTVFAGVLLRLQESTKCQRLPFMSFLLLPFQRITRIKMLIENILKRTKEGTREEQTASKALASVSKIIVECNTQVGRMKQMEELIDINKTLEFDKLKAVPIISQTRFLEKRGELQDVAKGGTIFKLRPKSTPVFLYLFNDLLVIASRKSSERFVVLDYAHRSLVQVKALGNELPSGGLDNCFLLTLLENNQGRLVERVLKAATESDVHRWVAAFPNPDDIDRDADEVIYDDWDCPQVQCVEQYVAQQADEISLEPTEIINVIRKTNEGCYEGIRLSDGQKGWFPIANVLEITNEHVRRRNLRERYRVIQAASIVTGKGRLTL
ncbi:rho guanine nucleotide exchange factor 15 [Clupea harengus]|uniref:Rho guanine nucleotide exchange factor 15 n=1 Tax=Clupea harengus TaxID=7950 RepID=A0A6P8H0B4_CLUHA|nr:rho guanine nucleotide exchange factor 15 [Clupea harengus]XP_031441153.1 rho guanine nucleotide exchange factor 15 [Clupea harengus]XP_031441154.1 rho guanine nucleotide exchange factor 15 [Clupea harengus]